MSQTTVIYDACVLYPAPLRSLLMYLAMTDLYRARWTNEIHEEWMRNVAKNIPNFTRQQAEKIRDLMNAHVLDCLVSGYEALIPSLTLPDANDRHVLAAAIHCGADTIVTFNRKDFPEEALRPYGIEAQHPDDFLSEQIDLATSIVCGAANQQRQSLSRPPMTVEQYLTSLKRQGLYQTVLKLQRNADSI